MNSGKANKAAMRLLLWSVVALAALFLAAWVGSVLGSLIISFFQVFIALWIAFAIAVVYLFRDPDPVEPADLHAIVAPAHGTVDVIEDAVETEFMKGTCKRISIRVSLLDVQVQYAPVNGTVAHLEHRFAGREVEGRVENLLVGFEAVGRRDARVTMRLTGGTWGPRILPWIKWGEVVPRSMRIAMMRPAGRVDLFLPPTAKLNVRAGEELSGGQSVVAKWEEGN